MELPDPNHYAVLGVERNATNAQVASAYRRKALKCHPDKDRDNPSAAQSFHKVTEALNILTNPASRAAFDKRLDDKIAEELYKNKLHAASPCNKTFNIEDIFKKHWQNDRSWVYKEMDAMERSAAASPAAQQRNQEAEKLRKWFKNKLEASEKAASLVAEQQRHVAEQLEREKENLRKAGRKYQAEQERLKYQAEQKRQDLNTVQNPVIEPEDIALDHSLILRLKWRSKKSDDTNGGYSADVIKYLFSSYGEVSAVIVSNKKKGSAIVEFSTDSAALDAFQREHGLPSNPLTVTRSSPIEVKSASAPRSPYVEINSPIIKETSPQSETNKIISDFEKLQV